MLHKTPCIHTSDMVELESKHIHKESDQSPRTLWTSTQTILRGRGLCGLVGVTGDDH